MRRLSFRDQRGSVLALVAIMLPALLGMGMIVVDIANWWVHKRHLQQQADSSVLAAAQLLRYPCNTATNTLVAQEADKYAGATTSTGIASPGAAFHLNAQISLGTGESVLGLLNSPTYPDGQGSANDGEVNSGSPCGDNAVDMKLTDKSIPYLFTIGALGHVNVHARAAVVQAGSAKGQLPYAVTDPTPQTVVARLYDDSGTNVGGSDITLTQTAPASDPGEFESSPVTVTLPPAVSGANVITGASPGDYSQPAINVRIAASGGPPPISSSCSGTTEQCYPNPSSLKGLVQLRAWPQHDPTSKDVAVFHSVQLGTSGQAGCGRGADAYFMRIPQTAGPCFANITAVADFNSTVTSYPSTGSNVAPGANDNAIVCMNTSTSGFLGSASPIGSAPCGNDKGTVQLKYTALVSGHHQWTGQVSVPDETTTAGPTYISLWGIAQQNGSHVTIGGTVKNCTSNTQNPCIQTPIPAQKVFSGSLNLSGYLDTVTVTDISSDPYNRPQCFTACGGTTMKFIAHFQQLKPAADKNDPIFYLRVTGGQNNQTIDCGDGNNTRNQIIYGCQNPFRKWVSGTDPLCSTITSYGSMTQPYPCINGQPGTTAGQVGQGMQTRILGTNSGCPDQFRNHWSQYPWATPATINLPIDDNRLMPVFITRFGGFSNVSSGANNFYPVTGFAMFYVTGWSGQGKNADPCTSGTPPAGANWTVDDDPCASTTGGAGSCQNQDTIVGHFVNLVDPEFVPTPGNTPCDLSSLSLCTPVLVD